MATRSHIIAPLKDGTWGMIYVHWDGSPDTRGPLLLEHFMAPIKVQQLIGLGACSVLAPSIKKPPGHTFAKPVDGFSTFYKRDRGDDGVQARQFRTLELAMKEATEEYVYVFQQLQDDSWGWWWSEGSSKGVTFRSLRRLTKGEEAAEPMLTEPEPASSTSTIYDTNPLFGLF